MYQDHILLDLPFLSFHGQWTFCPQNSSRARVIFMETFIWIFLPFFFTMLFSILISLFTKILLCLRLTFHKVGRVCSQCLNMCQEWTKKNLLPPRSLKYFKSKAFWPRRLKLLHYIYLNKYICCKPFRFLALCVLDSEQFKD